MDRRSFLRRSMYFTVVAASAGLSACNDGGDGDGEEEVSGRYGFPQGVASGDPRAESVVFWSRCVPSDGSGGDVALRLQVSASEGFSSLVADVPLTATATYDHTLRAKVTGLASDTFYWYRFVAGADMSPVGRARTAPAATASRDMRFAWFTCQDWSVNHWGALSLMLEEELDFTVHLGDYIYETVGADFQSGAVEPAHGKITLPDGMLLADGSTAARTLADYRSLYKTYRSDSRIQAVHGKFPLIAIWDDHEFSDDAWQDHQTYTNANVQETSRRRAANQAWAEYMPVDFGDVSFDLGNAAYDNIRIYRDFRFGQLLHLVMTDERLYRDDHVVSEALIAQQTGADPVQGDSSVGARYFVPKDVLDTLEGA
ncbi:MAG: alkaline phosphatase D family protein, partial [Azovibrio sp.]|nr:alkaline phosphatase D family protein [Azovibrio sp.]